MCVCVYLLHDLKKTYFLLISTHNLTMCSLSLASSIYAHYKFIVCKKSESYFLNNDMLTL